MTFVSLARSTRMAGRVQAWDWRTRALGVAVLLATVGASIPLVMMVHGVVVEDLTYKAWTWPAIPAVWLGCLLGAGLALRYRTIGAVVLVGAAAAGAYAFEPEHGIFTFGGAWLIGLGLYLNEAGILRRGDD